MWEPPPLLFDEATALETGTAPALFGRARSTHSGWSPSWDQALSLFSLFAESRNALFNLLEFFLGFGQLFPLVLNDLGGCFGHKPFVG